MNAAERRTLGALRSADGVRGLQEAIADAVERMAAGGRKAAREYESFHWGIEPDGTRAWEAPLVRPHDVLTELGELVEVSYQTTKDEAAVWVHAFQTPRPVLASTSTGRIVVVGGNYQINRRGIVG